MTTQGHSATVVRGTWEAVKGALVTGALPRWQKEMMFADTNTDMPSNLLNHVFTNRSVQDYMCACEALLKVGELSNEEAEAVEEMFGRIADKFLNDGGS